MKEVPILLRTAALSTMRRFLAEREFIELALPASTPYRIEGAKQFRITPRSYLRYTAEPDIWLASEGLDRFFWAGSVFRNEKADALSGTEFTMLAFYARKHTVTQMVSLFFHLLREFEQDLLEPYLTNEPLRYATHKEFFSPGFEKKQDGWVIVTEYPKDRSFYDMESLSGNTLRFGVFYLHRGKVIDVANGGTVGENRNPRKRIKGHRVPRDISGERIIGLRLGLERLILLYALVENDRSLAESE